MNQSKHIKQIQVRLPCVFSVRDTNLKGRNERIEHLQAGDSVWLEVTSDIEVFNQNDESLGYLEPKKGVHNSMDLSEICDYMMDFD